MDKYRLEYRYQYRSREGVVNTPWMLYRMYDERKEAQREQVRQKEQVRTIDRATKLLHEFRIIIQSEAAR